MGKDTFSPGAQPDRLGTVVGNTIGQASLDAHTSDLCLHNGDPVLALCEPEQSTGRIRGPFVKTWDGSSWTQLGGELETFVSSIITGTRYDAAAPQIRSDGDDLYIAYTVHEKGIGSSGGFNHLWLHVVVQKWDGSAWSVVYDDSPHVADETRPLMPFDFDVSDAAPGEWHVIYSKGNIQPQGADTSTAVGIWYGAHDTGGTRILTTQNLGSSGGVTHHILADAVPVSLRCDSGTPFAFLRVDFAAVDADPVKNHFYAVRMMNPRTVATVQTLDAPVWGSTGTLTSRSSSVGAIQGVSKKVTRGGDELYLLMLFPPNVGDPPYTADREIRELRPKVVQVEIDGSAAFELIEGDDPNGDQPYGSPHWAYINLVDSGTIDNPDGFGNFAQDDSNDNLYWIASPVSGTPTYPSRTGLFRDACPGVTPAKEWVSIGHNTSGGLYQAGLNTFPFLGDTGPLDGRNATVPRPHVIGNYVYVNAYWPGVFGSGSGDPENYQNAQHIVYRQRICRGCDACLEGTHINARSGSGHQ
jgi:hypothetical protein